ncbi:MAG: hypothetical protein IPG34_19710 [Rhodocyclaceae bacterium]|nr:hypothetical protein [Rhodocyclaceae bacterium]
MVTDAKLGIAAVAIEGMAAQCGLTSRGLVEKLVGLYFPDEMASFIRRANSRTATTEPTERLVRMLAGYGYQYAPETGFTKSP